VQTTTQLRIDSLVVLCVIATFLGVLSRGTAAPAPPVKLNGSLRNDAGVEDFEISADNKWVVYRADQDTNGVR
jgi:hypothetical protein